MNYRQVWEEYLRSGRFGQTQNVLRGIKTTGDEEGTLTNNFCCLGVAGQVLVDQNLTTWNERGELRTENGDAETDGALTKEWCKLFGLNAGQQSVLITLNDDKNLDFNGIADALSMPEFLAVEEHYHITDISSVATEIADIINFRRQS